MVQQDNENKDYTQNLPQSNTTPLIKQNSSSNSLILMLEQFDTFADYILNSDYRKQFEKTITDDDGKTKRIAEKGDIIACLTLGNELGISPMGSIALGKQLNAKSYFSVIKGRELGLDPITSISKIYNIETKNGTVLSLAVDIITKVLLENNCILDYIRDYELTPMYRSVETKVYVGHKYNILNSNGELLNSFYIYDKNSTNQEDLKLAVTEGKIIIQRFGYTHVTSLRVIRKNKNLDITIHYSLQDATDADLFSGYHSSNVDKDGKPIFVSGKSNWNNHPATMLRNRVTSIAGRIAVADKLQGAYSHDEVMEIINVSNEKDLEYAQEV
jgi:hypothetical protein